MQATKRVKDPRKQRKRLYNAPAHLRHKLMAAPLSPELVKSKGVKSLPVRKGDTVRVVRGDHTGFEGKVNRVDLKRYRIFIEGLTREKVDGTTIFVSVHPSKVIIKNLKLDDKWRKAVVEFKKEQAPPKKEKKLVKVVEKRPKKAKEEKPAEKAPKPAPKRVQKKPAAKKTKEEKPVKKPKAATAVKKKPASEPKTAQKKPSETKKEKTVAKKKTKPAAEKSSLKKEKKPKAVKKAPAKRKTAASKKKGGT